MILYGELERGGSYDDEGGVEGGENFFLRIGSGLMILRVIFICRL